jgi:predicted esterase
MNAQEHRLSITRTARYWTLGSLTPETQQIWFVLHGYGQLAEYFIRNFRILDDGTRFIVAPEGLSKFYLKEFTGRIGATWMTREDRETEIQDYVAYLDQLYRHVTFNTDKNTTSPSNTPMLHVLGFSQGVTTACRWLARGSVRAKRLICWAGGLPAEWELSAPGSRERALLQDLVPVFVAGTTDEFITNDVLAQQKERIEAAGLPYHLVLFDGGHHLDADVLRRLLLSNWTITLDSQNRQL